MSDPKMITCPVCGQEAYLVVYGSEGFGGKPGQCRACGQATEVTMPVADALLPGGSNAADFMEERELLAFETHFTAQVDDLMDRDTNTLELLERTKWFGEQIIVEARDAWMWLYPDVEYQENQDTVRGRLEAIERNIVRLRKLWGLSDPEESVSRPESSHPLHSGPCIAR